MRLLPPTPALVGQPQLPGDKSLSHRALMLAALAHGPSTLWGLAPGEDVQATARCLQALGVAIAAGPEPNSVVVQGRGPQALVAPQAPLDCGNSGTTLRLLMGLLAGLGLPAELTGDASLRARPMGRIAGPLIAMGARITLASGNTAPVCMHPCGQLVGMAHRLPMASGQLKGALLLAGLHAQGPTTLTGALGGRDHTETLLRACGAAVRSAPEAVVLAPSRALQPLNWHIPHDISAAAFWLAASQVVPHARLHLQNVGLNPTRTGFVRALGRMGARILRAGPGGPDGAIGLTPVAGEPTGDLWVRRTGPLTGIALAGDAIAPLIDELPLLIGMATLARGVTTLRDAGELRVKETDRIAAMVDNMRRMGARIEERSDGVRVVGPQRLYGARLDSFGDHRVAMAASVMAMASGAPCSLRDAGCVAVSDPHFFATWRALAGGPQITLD